METIFLGGTGSPAKQGREGNRARKHTNPKAKYRRPRAAKR
jgi:hypothetical protein